MSPILYCWPFHCKIAKKCTVSEVTCNHCRVSRWLNTLASKFWVGVGDNSEKCPIRLFRVLRRTELRMITTHLHMLWTFSPSPYCFLFSITCTSLIICQIKYLHSSPFLRVLLWKNSISDIWHVLIVFDNRNQPVNGTAIVIIVIINKLIIQTKVHPLLHKSY